MNEVTLECLGLDEDTIDKMCDPQCYTVYCNDKFHIAAFFIPAGRGLPLHDHPSMAVLSKV
jgi:hypothetical protein